MIMSRKLVKTTIHIYEDQVTFAKQSPRGLSEFVRQSVDNEIESYPVISKAKVAALDTLTENPDMCSPATLYDVVMRQGIIIPYIQIEKYLKEKKTNNHL